MLTAAIVIASIFTYLAIGVATATICYRYNLLDFRSDPEFTIPYTVFLWAFIWLLGAAIMLGKGVTHMVRMFADVSD